MSYNEYMFSTRPHCTLEEGFTLIEVLVSISILLMIGSSVIAFERSVLTSSKVLQAELNSQQQVRRTLAAFVSNVRGATQSATGGYAIESAGTSTLVFYTNIDKDSLVERVRYFVSASTLMRGVIKPVGALYLSSNESITRVVSDVANDSSSPVFVYYDSAYDGFTSSSTDPLPLPVNIPAIRLIQIVLTVNPNGVRSPVMQTYSTQVSIRNLKDNL